MNYREPSWQPEEPETLFEHATFSFEFSRRKHGHEDDYVETSINAMSNYEFLTAISEAMESMKEVTK